MRIMLPICPHVQARAGEMFNVCSSRMIIQTRIVFVCVHGPSLPVPGKRDLRSTSLSRNLSEPPAAYYYADRLTQTRSTQTLYRSFSCMFDCRTAVQRPDLLLLPRKNISATPAPRLLLTSKPSTLLHVVSHSRVVASSESSLPWLMKFLL